MEAKNNYPKLITRLSEAGDLDYDFHKISIAPMLVQIHYNKLVLYNFFQGYYKQALSIFHAPFNQKSYSLHRDDTRKYDFAL